MSETLEERLARLTKVIQDDEQRFSEDQPRDPDGKFASGGGSAEDHAVALSDLLDAHDAIRDNPIRLRVENEEHATKMMLDKVPALTTKVEKLNEKAGGKEKDKIAGWLDESKNFMAAAQKEWDAGRVSAASLEAEKGLIMQHQAIYKLSDVIGGRRSQFANPEWRFGLRFDPDQPRDPDGKFASGGGSEKDSGSEKGGTEAGKIDNPIKQATKEEEAKFEAAGQRWAESVGHDVSDDSLPVETIDPKDVITNQKQVDTDVAKHAGSEMVVVHELAGKYFIFDGNHRVAHALLNGKTVQAHVLHLGEWAKRSLDPEQRMEPAHEYGTTQVNLPESPAFRRLQQRIEPDDLAGDGLAERAHLTVCYGLLDPEKAVDQLADVFANVEAFDVVLGGTRSFTAGPHSDMAVPVYVAVAEGDYWLQVLNALIKTTCVVKRSDFAEYVPHVCVAYVKPGAEQKYYGWADMMGVTVHVASVWVLDRNGNSVELSLADSVGGGEEEKEKEVRLQLLTPRAQVELAWAKAIASQSHLTDKQQAELLEQMVADALKPTEPALDVVPADVEETEPPPKESSRTRNISKQTMRKPK